MVKFKEAKAGSFQNTTSSLTVTLPTNEGKGVPKTEGDEPTLVIIISSICGTMTILTIAIAVACVKYDRWKRSRATESTLSHENQIPLDETNTPETAEYEDIGDLDNNPQRSKQTATIRPINQSSQPYQSLQVCRESPYLRINERPTRHDKTLEKETNITNYERMTRSQIGDHVDAYQALEDGTGSEINEVHQYIDIIWQKKSSDI